MAAPFSPGEFGKQDADWHSPHQQSKKRGRQTGRQIYIPTPDTTRRPAIPTGSGCTTESNPLSLWDPTEKNHLPK